jgi:hypothetical protein
MQEIWTGGGILPPHTLSMPSSCWALNEDLTVYIFGVKRCQYDLNHKGSSLSIENRAPLKGPRENTGAQWPQQCGLSVQDEWRLSPSQCQYTIINKWLISYV